MDDKGKLMICMPYEKCNKPCAKGTCFVCGGEIGINPRNFLGKPPVGLQTVCGGCALDFIDAEPEAHKFGLTDAQEAKSIYPAIRDALGGMDNMAKEVIAYMRKNREKFSAKGKGGAV